MVTKMGVFHVDIVSAEESIYSGPAEFLAAPGRPQTFRILSPRPMPEAPVLTVSMIEVGSIA